jgi:hypothetical protein
MRESPLRLIKRLAEFQPKERVKSVPTNRRGLYVLYNFRQVDGQEHYDVVYVGMGTRGIKSRLKSHVKSERKGAHWTHFSAFEVWDNIRDEEIVELEGLFRHIYRRDTSASALNLQRTFKKAEHLQKDFEAWG